jgi:hypothetical protein
MFEAHVHWKRAAELMNKLALHGEGLSVLVHPNTRLPLTSTLLFCIKSLAFQLGRRSRPHHARALDWAESRAASAAVFCKQLAVWSNESRPLMQCLLMWNAINCFRCIQDDC